MEQKEVGASARHNCGEATVGHPADGSERAGFSGGVRAVHYLAAPARRMLLIRRIGSYQLPLSGSGAGGSWRLRPPELRRGSGRPPGHETLPDRSPFVNGLPSTPRPWFNCLTVRVPSFRGLPPKCRRGESNPHGDKPHCALNAARMPIPPLRHLIGPGAASKRTGGGTKSIFYPVLIFQARYLSRRNGSRPPGFSAPRRPAPLITAAGSGEAGWPSWPGRVRPRNASGRSCRPPPGPGPDSRNSSGSRHRGRFRSVRPRT